MQVASLATSPGLPVPPGLRGCRQPQAEGFLSRTVQTSLDLSPSLILSICTSQVPFGPWVPSRVLHPASPLSLCLPFPPLRLWVPTPFPTHTSPRTPRPVPRGQL